MSESQDNLRVVGIASLGESPGRGANRLAAAVLALVLGGYVLLEGLLPLGTAVQIGADEGFELAKATLCLKGRSLYTEVWNDQPPLHTWLISGLLRRVSASVLGPRLVSVGFAVVLLGSLFVLCRRVSGVGVAGLAAALVVASPGFLELSSSCMLEIPSLATAVAALALLLAGGAKHWPAREACCGVVFGLALQIKLVPAILLSLAAVIVWVRERDGARPRRRTLASLAALGASLAATYVAVDWLIEGGAYLRYFGQSWASHFGAAKSLEYGSAAEHGFDWGLLLKNWDTTLPALFGVVVLVRRLRESRMAALPLSWLALCMAVFTLHRPWWPYYYVHTSLPLCWCAAEGIHALAGRLRRGRSRWLAAALAVYAVCALSWMVGRLYLQAQGMRHSAQLYSEPVLREMARLRPYAESLYAERTVYSFHAGIAMPPQLAVLPVKRFWAGEMSR